MLSLDIEYLYTPSADNFAALHGGAKPIDNKRALSNDARKFISEEYTCFSEDY